MYQRGGIFAACLALVFAAGCSVKNGLEIGPIAMQIPMGAGIIDPSQFPDPGDLPLAIGTVRRDICDLPTEEQLTEVFRTAGSIDLSSVVRLSRLQLEKTVLHVTTGSLEGIKAVQIYFVPKSGSIFGAVNLGGTYSLTGFGDTLEIEPPAGVDLLELVQENDAMFGDGCPQLVVHAAGQAPDEPIEWEAHLEVNGYARLGLF